MSKQADQRYRKEFDKKYGLGHEERAKDKGTDSVKDMASREGYGDGNPYGYSDKTDKKSDKK